MIFAEQLILSRVWNLDASCYVSFGRTDWLPIGQPDERWVTNCRGHSRNCYLWHYFPGYWILSWESILTSFNEISRECYQSVIHVIEYVMLFMLTNGPCSTKISSIATLWFLFTHMFVRLKCPFISSYLPNITVNWSNFLCIYSVPETGYHFSFRWVFSDPSRKLHFLISDFSHLHLILKKVNL